ncbi:B-cell receptor-associated protein 29 isoform X1 [Chelonia mydas]|uniref:B-cell receptor-associated protein 29 isoform X1 n=2 Tax=Cheloniidae TaxID=8465 RepID=UPI001CA84814|nr:B-cell receptor-associated protein 29 isoform X1 [Chelonia mydas]
MHEASPPQTPSAPGGPACPQSRPGLPLGGEAVTEPAGLPQASVSGCGGQGVASQAAPFSPPQSGPAGLTLRGLEAGFRGCPEAGFCSVPSREKMTFQWTAVATFLYTEIGVILLLCVPFISPLRWQKIFVIPVWNKIANYWNKAFLTIIVLLIVLFLDAIREVKKYSTAHGTEKAANINPNAYDHIQMKLFRSQRNLYISGFSLFLWLVLRRTVTLITQLAKEMGIQVAMEIQVANTNEAARKYMEENEKLQQALNEKGKCENEQALEEDNKKLRQETEKLKAELKKTLNALSKATNEVTAVKKQSEGLKREYDRLMKEHERLQDLLDEEEDKKDL